MSSISPIEFKSLRILLVEDNPTDAGLIQERLRKSCPGEGQIEHVTCLDAALTRIKNIKFDLVLTDLYLPDSKGIEVVEHLMAAMNSVPIVVLTAVEDQELAIKALRMGAQDFVLKKAINGPVLLRILSYVLERHRYHSELQQSQERYLRLFNHVPVGVFSTTQEGIIRSVNFALLELFDTRQAEKLLGQSLYSLFSIPEEVAAFRKQLEEIGLVRNMEIDFLSLDKGEHIGLVNAVLNRDDRTGNKIIEGTISDVTALKHAENERFKMQQELRMAQRLEAVGILASGIAHEINTPCQFIIDNLNFLNETTNEIMRYFATIETLTHSHGASMNREQIVESLTTALNEGDLEYIKKEWPLALKESLEGMYQIKKIVSAMKEFSHPGGDENEAMDLNRSVELSCTVTHNEWKYVAELEQTLEQDLPKISGSSTYMNLVLTNLIINATHAIEDLQTSNANSKAKQRGKISIRTQKNSTHVILEVRDTGCGMSQDVLDNIFVPFFTTKNIGRGTGQGMHMVHRIVVEGHGGSIEVASKPNLGTRILIHLPILKPPHIESRKTA